MLDKVRSICKSKANNNNSYQLYSPTISINQTHIFKGISMLNGISKSDYNPKGKKSNSMCAVMR